MCIGSDGGGWLEPLGEAISCALPPPWGPADGEWFSAPEQAKRLSQGDMLRLDAAVLMVQLNLRLMLEVRGQGR